MLNGQIYLINRNLQMLIKRRAHLCAAAVVVVNGEDGVMEQTFGSNGREKEKVDSLPQLDSTATTTNGRSSKQTAKYGRRKFNFLSHSQLDDVMKWQLLTSD